MYINSDQKYQTIILPFSQYYAKTKIDKEKMKEVKKCSLKNNCKKGQHRPNCCELLDVLPINNSFSNF